MARFDVCENQDRRSAGAIPYLLVIQHDLFDGLATRLVVPLFRPEEVPRPMSGLNPVLELDGEPLVLMVPEMAGVPRATLGPVVGSLADQGPTILAAVDFLISGV